MTITGTEAFSLDLSDRYVVWAETRGGRVPTVIEAYDRQTKAVSTVATADAGEYVDKPHVDRDTLIYTQLKSTAQDAVSWRIIRRDLVTGHVTTIEDHLQESQLVDVPLPALSWPWVVWADAAPAAPGAELHAVLHVYDLRTSQQRTLDPGGQPDFVSVDGGRVIYDGLSTADKTDVYIVSLSGAVQPHQLSTSGRVANPRARNGLVVWQEPPSTNPDSLWAVRLDQLASRPVHFAGPDPFPGPENPYPGDGFVLYDSPGEGSALVVQTLDGPGTSRAVAGKGDIDVPARWNASGRFITWATETGHGAASIVTVHLARVDL